MVAVTSVRERCLSSRAFRDPDPQVRIAAIHMIASHDGDPRERLVPMLEDESELVALYAAIALAQARCAEGIDFLVRGLGSARYKGRLFHQYALALQNCARFPFAVLLAHLTWPNWIYRIRDRKLRQFLVQMLHMTDDEFYSKARENRDFRDDVLRTLVARHDAKGLKYKHSSVCKLGLILQTPSRRRAGVVCVPVSGDILEFAEQEVINREQVQFGREVLIVFREKNPKHGDKFFCVMEDSPRLAVAVPKSLLEDRTPRRRLLVGLVNGRRDTDHVEILHPCGEVTVCELVGADDACAGQLALVKRSRSTNRSRPQCFVIEGYQLPEAIHMSMVKSHAKNRGAVIARIAKVFPSIMGQSRRIEVMRRRKPLRIPSEAGDPGEYVLLTRHGPGGREYALDCVLECLE